MNQSVLCLSSTAQLSSIDTTITPSVSQSTSALP
jgi:hypothetical protein